MYKLFTYLLLLGVTPFIHGKTTVYHCTINGVATFSQLPCAKDAKEINIANTNVAKSTLNSGTLPARAEITNYLTGQQIDNQIAEHKNTISKLQEQLNNRKIQIDYMTQDSANRLGASSINDAITQQRNKVDQLYKPKIEQLQARVDELTALKSKIDQGN